MEEACLSPSCQLRLSVFSLVLTHADAWDRGSGEKTPLWSKNTGLLPAPAHLPGCVSSEHPLPMQGGRKTGALIETTFLESQTLHAVKSWLPSLSAGSSVYPRRFGQDGHVESHLRANSARFYALFLPNLLPSSSLCLDRGPWRTNSRTPKPSWVLNSLAKADKELGK